MHYAKGARVHSPLESCVGILLLRSGQLRSYLLSEDGRDVTLYRLFGGEVCILSASCVMDAVNIDLYIDAEEDTEALCISAGIFRQLMQENVLLIALILLSIAISIALFLLSVVMTIIALFDGGGSKKRRFSLDNGDEVTEKSGLFGEKYYEGRSGKSYETNDNGRTFSEK